MNTASQHRGLRWHFEVTKKDGRVDRFHADNLVPTEGLNFLLSLAFKSATVVPAWFISIFEGDYTPTNDVTAATLPGLATEITAYTPSTRPEFVEGAVSNGSVSNAASLAEITFTQAKTVRVIAMTSASAKGSTAGVALSVVRLPSPKLYDVGDVMRVFAGPTATPVV